MTPNYTEGYAKCQLRPTAEGLSTDALSVVPDHATISTPITSHAGWCRENSRHVVSFGVSAGWAAGKSSDHRAAYRINGGEPHDRTDDWHHVWRSVSLQKPQATHGPENLVTPWSSRKHRCWSLLCEALLVTTPLPDPRYLFRICITPTWSLLWTGTSLSELVLVLARRFTACTISCFVHAMRGLRKSSWYIVTRFEKAHAAVGKNRKKEQKRFRKELMCQEKRSQVLAKPIWWKWNSRPHRSSWFHVMSTMSLCQSLCSVCRFWLQQRDVFCTEAARSVCVKGICNMEGLLHWRLNTSQGYPGYSFLWAGSVSRLVRDSACQRVSARIPHISGCLTAYLLGG